MNAQRTTKEELLAEVGREFLVMFGEDRSPVIARPAGADSEATFQQFWEQLEDEQPWWRQFPGMRCLCRLFFVLGWDVGDATATAPVGTYITEETDNERDA